MWYLKNISEEILVEPETMKEVKPNEIKSFSDEMVFLRFCAAHNGKVLVVDEVEYNRYLGSFGELGTKKRVDKILEKVLDVVKEQPDDENQDVAEQQDQISEENQSPKAKKNTKKSDSKK